MSEIKMDIAGLEAFVARVFPQAASVETQIERLTPGELHLRLTYNDSMLRPGGTLSGPTLMRLADQATFLLVLSMSGPLALAVTTNLNINFLAKPQPADVLAVAKILKLGKRLGVAEVSLYSDREAAEQLVAHATVTYSLPPKT